MSYISLIQKDLPLATWALDETPSSSAASDYFISQNGTYSTAQTTKAVPFIHGSAKSIILSANSGGYALSIPSLDMLSEKRKDEPFTIEFWLKFIAPDFSAPTSSTKILEKPGSQTGIYIHNSSIVAVVGDSAETVVTASVPVPNILKPLHIVMSYLNNSIVLYVNGQQQASSANYNVITNTYNSANESFRFIAQTGNLKYAIDTIAYYNRVLDIQTVRRHLAYGLGYEIPTQTASRFGGTRYNLSMSATKPLSMHSESWTTPESISNLINKDGYLTVKSIEKPKMLYALDKSPSVFSWNANGLAVAAGGYVTLDDPVSIAGNMSHGFGFMFYKPVSISTEETLVYIQNKNNPERYLRFFMSSNSLKYEIDGTAPVTLISSVTNSSKFGFGYYYNSATQQITVFYNGQTSPVAVSNTTFYPESIRLMSSPIFDAFQNYNSADQVTTTYLQRIVHLNSVVSDIEAETNSYCAVANSTDKRFVMSSFGSYTFNVNLSRLASYDGIIGNHTIEWGSDSKEITIKATAGGSSTWFSGTKTLVNRSPLSELLSASVTADKFVKFVIEIKANDIERNRPKIYYFRIFKYQTTYSNPDYKTSIISDGPAVVVSSTSSKNSILPPRHETPFFYNEEKGGLLIANNAVITQQSSTIDSTTGNSGINAISFFINTKSNTANILSITDSASTPVTYSLTKSGTTISTTATPYINGNTTSSTTITNDEWNHISLVFGTRLIAPVTITFGGTTPDFCIDEIITYDTDITSYVGDIYKLYVGNNIKTVDSADRNVSIFDTEILNSNYKFTSYQPISSEIQILDPVNLAASSKPSTYSSLASLYIDGKAITIGDRVLVTGASPGIYTVGGTLTAGSSITWTQQTITGNAIVYVKDGLINEGKYYFYNGSTWSETSALPKIKTYHIEQTPVSISSYSSLN